MEDKYTDVMSEISVKNSLINHLEKENDTLKAELEEMRNEYNIAQDGITDLNDVLKDMQEESKEQIKENKRLQDKLQALNDDYNNDHKVHNEYEALRLD